MVGDFHGPEAWLTRIRFYYTPAERWLLLALVPLAAVIATWRCLVMNLAAGLSGSKFWYNTLNLLTGVVFTEPELIVDAVREVVGTVRARETP